MTPTLLLHINMRQGITSTWKVLGKYPLVAIHLLNIPGSDNWNVIDKQLRLNSVCCSTHSAWTVSRAVSIVVAHALYFLPAAERTQA
jgi:hypothetical protein